MDALVGPLAAFVLLGISLVALPSVIWYLVQPVERRAQAAQEPFRFRLIDLACLLVYFQVLLAGLAAATQAGLEGGNGAWILIGLVLAGVFVLAWTTCVNVLARAGIESSARRAAFILISVPGATVASSAFVMSGGLVCLSFGVYVAGESTGLDLVPFGFFAATCGVILALRRISLWIAAGSHTTESKTTLGSALATRAR